MRRLLRAYGVPVAVAACACLFVAFSPVCVAAARRALDAFLRSVLPALYPFLCLMLLLAAKLPDADRSARKRTLRAGGGRRGDSARFSPAVLPTLALGVLSGSPGGARMAASLYDRGLLDGRDMRLLTAASGTMSPAFFLGVLPSFVGGADRAALALGCHVAGALLTGGVVWGGMCRMDARRSADGARGASARRDADTPPRPPAALPAAITQSAAAMAAILGAMMLFAALGDLLAALLGGLPPLPACLLRGALEVSGGALTLPPDTRNPAALACLLTSFGGVSIAVQNLAYVRERGVSARWLFLCQAAHAVVSFALCEGLSRLIFS